MNYTIYIRQKKIQPFFKENMAEFEKRLSRYCKIKIVQLKKDSEISKAKHHGGKHYVVVTSTDSPSSVALSEAIKNLEVHGVSECSFYVGCVPDFEENEDFSVSRLEMDEGLIGAILTEQIYRAYRIINNQPYHK